MKLLLVMPRYRSMGLRPIQRVKHVVDQQNALVAGTTSTEDLIETVDAPVLANTREVITGSTVHAIYLKVEVVATSSAALSNVYMYILKNPGSNLTAGGLPAPNAVGSNDNKKFVIHQEMVMLQEQTGSNPRILFNGVIRIPRGYKRNGPGDKLQMKLLAPGNSMNYCLQAHYKEFR